MRDCHLPIVVHLFIDYDMSVELLNTIMDDKSTTNKEAIEKHITPLDDENRQEIKDIVQNIEAGEITKHFTTESLQNNHKKYRTERGELKIV